MVQCLKINSEVALFLCPVSKSCGDLLAKLLENLTEEERQRADRFSCFQAQQLFIVAHATLHWALAGLGVQNYEIASAPQGKPYLNNQPDLHFNLSHTQGMVAVALHIGQPIGVDVERLASVQTYLELAPRVMTAAECAHMAIQPVPEDRFTQLWSAKEALMKATGLGFGLPPRDIAFTGAAPCLSSVPSEHGLPQDWWIYSQRLPGHWLALASRSADLSVRSITLTPQDLVAQ